jgi:hypothetical protein
VTGSSREHLQARSCHAACKDNEKASVTPVTRLLRDGCIRQDLAVPQVRFALRGDDETNLVRCRPPDARGLGTARVFADGHHVDEIRSMPEIIYAQIKASIFFAQWGAKPRN